MKPFTIWLFASFLLCLCACSKDKIESEILNTEINSSSTIPLTIENIRAHYEQKISQTSSTTNFDGLDSILIILTNVDPLWDLADTLTYLGHIPVIFVPLRQCTTPSKDNQLFIVFFNDELTSEIDSRFLSIQSDDNYTLTPESVVNFSGKILQINWSGNLTHSFKINDGSISGIIQNRDAAQPRTYWECIEDILPYSVGEGGCGGYTIWVEVVVCTQVGGSSSGTGSGNTYGTNPFGWGNNDNYSWIPNNNGGGGSNPFQLSNFFNLNDFQGTDRLNAQLVNLIKEEYCLFKAQICFMKI